MIVGLLLAVTATASADSAPPVSRVHSVREYFETLDQRFRPEAARGLDVVIQFELSGVDGGNYNVAIRGAQMSLTSGIAPRANVTFRMNGADYVKVVNGEMSGTAAFMRGAMKIGGNLSLARKMSKVFPPGDIRARPRTKVALAGR